ncbi:5'-methylthioadenosine/S-adenosylhomocysteine nucleosidase [Morus notabilis]|uniref:5'-methylthioadenosine/S-adenosylhomocysteine nucleosidase n=1 Tax=Morus notabilis TaxID=981085 RepID=W9RMN4_9ROSA|nr:5'-methylthioadenosine/S-adenosylhomocysteine nucleosidase [Morus notabilis]
MYEISVILSVFIKEEDFGLELKTNAGITTQLLLSFFDMEGVVHYGIAGNANPSLNIGDVAVPQYWSHTALWNWQDLELEGCLDSTTCLSTTPKVYTVDKGTSASIYLDNAAYRGFIYRKFNISLVDMESASVALLCFQQTVPYLIQIRSLLFKYQQKSLF